MAGKKARPSPAEPSKPIATLHVPGEYADDFRKAALKEVVSSARRLEAAQAELADETRQRDTTNGVCVEEVEEWMKVLGDDAHACETMAREAYAAATGQGA